MSSSNVSLKLLVHKTSRKILFGQADKKFIDFLFTILALPIATIFNLLSTDTTTVPLRNLYHSFKNLDVNDFQQKYHNNMNFLLKPKVQISRHHASSISNLLPIESSLPPKSYKCPTSNCTGYYASNWNATCPGCKNKMNYPMQYVTASPNEAMMKELMEERSWGEKTGYVKDKVCYMVMEDLALKPMSFMSSISMLAEFGVDDASLIEEKHVYLDHKLALDLLRASICGSSTVLSDVFLQDIDFEEQIVEENVKNFKLQL